MEKRSLGVQKKTIKRKKKFLKTIADYLTSDSYMYAPLVPHPVDPSMPKIHSSSTRKEMHLTQIQKLFRKTQS